MNCIRDIPRNQFVILYIPICHHVTPNASYRAVTGRLSKDGFQDIDGYSITTRYGQPVGWSHLPEGISNASNY